MGNLLGVATFINLILRGVLLAEQAIRGPRTGAKKRKLAADLAETVVDGLAAGGNDEARAQAGELKAAIGPAIDSAVSVLNESGIFRPLGPDSR